MFRRKRSSSQHHHPLSTSSTQSAQSAATHAFLNSQPSSSSLSSAAAAAALRSLTPTPTPVENVQTKRMLQRQTSVSSQIGRTPSLRPVSRNGLRRANSSASLSARTFRDQSPRRPASSYGSAGVAPPLPSIPQEYAARRNQNRRSVSLGPQVWSSDSHRQSTERVKNQEQAVAEPGSPRSPHGPGLSKPQPEHQRSASRSSINFSYPMSSRTNSPTIPSGVPGRRDATVSVQRTSPPPADSPHHDGRFAPSDRAPQQARPAGPGSPGRGPRPVGTALAAAQAAAVPRNDVPNTPGVSPRAPRHRERAVSERSPSQSPASVDIRSRSSPTLVKRPFTVVEDREAEERSDTGHSRDQDDHSLVNGVPSSQPARVKTPPAPERTQDPLRMAPVSPPESNLSTEVDGETQPPHLRQSSSPGRTARFSTQLSVINFGGDHLHQPPPRSVSPAKSALKISRMGSVSPDDRTHGILRPGPPLSEISDATSVASDDGAKPSYRRKPVKVSFDDEAEIVGVAASPPTSPEDTVPDSPPGKSRSKTSWLGFHKGKSSLLRSVETDEFDGVLKPRQALPSFGSIRASRNGTRSEIFHRELSDNESTASSDPDTQGPNRSFSSDHAIGNLVSPASPEPVQKQSQVEDIRPDMHVGADAAAMPTPAETEKENIPACEPDLQDVHFYKTRLSPLPEAPSEQHQVLSPNPNLAVPDISFQPATPEIDKGRSSLETYDVPGDFPRSSVEMESTASSQKGKGRFYGGAPATSVTSAVDSRVTDDESSESIYSDAEEGLNGDGLGSINAILDRETVPASSAASEHGLAITSAPPDVNTQFSQDITTPDVPDTCRIAGMGTPVSNALSPSSPDSPNEPLSFSSPYPPFPTQPKAKASSVNGEVPRSSTMPVEVHTIAKIQDAPDRPVGNSRTNRAHSQVPHVRQGRGQATKRAESWGPTVQTLRNGSDVRHNGNGPDATGNSAPMLRRQASNGSDSSSSFKRSRRVGRRDGMRRTLRGSQPSSTTTSSPTGTAVSSAESRPIPSGQGAGTMRTTLRGTAPKNEKSSFFSAGKPPKGRHARAVSAPFTSRFPDSDSESDGGYRSRALQRRRRNASEENLRPVRGIPRRHGTHDGDSTELEDSSDNERHSVSGLRTPARQRNRPSTIRDPALAAVARSRGMTEEQLEELLSRSPPRKPSLLQRLNIRKSKPLGDPGRFHLNVSSTNGTIAEHPRTEHAQEDGVQDELRMNDSQRATSVAVPPRLLKKSSQKPSGGDTWPLRTERADVSDPGAGSTGSPSAKQLARSQTSDGADVNGNKAAVKQPITENSNDPQSTLDKVQSLMNTAGNRASDVVIESSGRKKRFHRLRKAFGLRG